MPKLTFGFGRMTHAEYRANLDGLNMFFGAMLGLVMAGTERLSGPMFGAVLLMISGIVVTILYVSASRHRLGYSVLAVAMTALIPTIIDDLLGARGALPDKVQPTLIVWAVMTIAIEFYPRDRDASVKNARDEPRPRER